MPDETTGRLFNYSRTEADGSMVFTTTATARQLGDALVKKTDGTMEYRYSRGGMFKFNTGGKLIAQISRNGNMTMLGYTGGNLTSITDSVGRSVTLSYSSGRISGMADSTGRTWQYSYDGGNRVSMVTDPAGKTQQIGYDQFSRITQMTDKRGNIAKQLVYDANGRVAEQRFADGGFQKYNYGLSGQTVTSATVTDSVGRSISKRFNGAGYVLEHTDALGQTSKFNRDLTTNLVTAVTGACNCQEGQMQYNAQGFPTLVVDRLGHTTALEYEPAYNKVAKITDALGRVTTYAYDVKGNMTAMTNALNQTTTYTYDSFGQRTSVTDPLGHTTMFEYDVKGNQTATIDPLGNRYTREYDNLGRMTATVDPMGRRTTYQYDSRSRLIAMTDPTGATTTYEYDNNSNITAVVNALGKRWTRTYDNKNRLLSATDPLSRTTRYQYNSKGEMITATAPSGRTTRYTYDARGLVTSVTDPLGSVVRFTYDNRGNLVSLKDQRGNETVYNYDELDRQIARRDPLGKVSSVVYNALDNVIEATDRLGRRTVANYDELNRPVTVAYVDAVVAYTYDAGGRRTRIDDTQSDSIQWTYDNADRRTAEMTPQGTVTYSYNAASQRTLMSVGDRQPVSYGYDIAGRLRTITQSAEIFTYSYDTLSRMLSLQRPNGVTTAYSYDDVNRLLRLTHTNGAAVPIEDVQYIYNANGETISTVSLASASLLPTPKIVGLADAANRIPQFGQSIYGTDNIGQVTSRTNAQASIVYQWDSRGRLISASKSDGQVVRYVYDSLGRMQSRSIGDSTVKFLYDKQEVVADLTNNGIVIEYLNGGGYDNKLRLKNDQSEVFFLLDRLGTTLAVTDMMGSLIQRIGYEAFGSSSGGQLSRYGFTGREIDPVSGLLYYRKRWFDPELGRFLSEDPIGHIGGINLYTYVMNSPLNYSDPLGLIDYNKPSPDTVPVTGDTLKALECTEGCLGGIVNNPDLSLFVTGGAEKTGHSTNSHHYKGEACDIAGPQFPRHKDLKTNDVMNCAAKCGFGAGQYETFANDPNRNHWHLQKEAGNGVPAISTPTPTSTPTSTPTITPTTTPTIRQN